MGSLGGRVFSGGTGASAGPSSQAQWHVDWTTGSDSNSGATFGTALKTARELTRRTQGAGGAWRITSGQTRSVFFHSSVLEANGDLWNPFVEVEQTGQLFITGSPTILGVGVFTAVTVQNPATNVPWDVTGPGLSAFVGKCIRITAGPNAGTQSWISKDLGANRVRLMEAETYDGSDFEGGKGAFAVGDTFEVVSMPTVHSTQADLRGGYPPEGLILLRDIRWFAAPSTFGALDVSGLLAQGINCELSGLFLGPVDMGFINCLVTGSCFITQVGTTFTGGGVLNSAIFVSNGADLFLHGQHGYFTLQNSSITISLHGHLAARGLSAFDSASPVQFTGGGCGALGSHIYWGTGNTGSSAAFAAGTYMTYNAGASFPIVNAGSDFTIEGFASGWTEDPATGAVAAGPVTYTWAHLVAAIGAGGFGGSAARKGAGMLLSVNES